MARKTGGLFTGQVSELRSVTASPIAIDNATLTDVNIPPSAAIDCTGFDTIFVSCEITLGSGPTIDVEPLFRDAEAADGSRWKRMKNGLAIEGTPAEQTTGAMTSGGDLLELYVGGHKSVFLRVRAVANTTNTTGYKILGMPGRIRPGYKENRSAG